MNPYLGAVLGALAGAAGGYLLSRVRPCGSQACNVKARTAYSMLAGAVFGAAFVYYLLTR